MDVCVYTEVQQLRCNLSQSGRSPMGLMDMTAEQTAITHAM